jgi:methionine-S-sulfoxide reductase
MKPAVLLCLVLSLCQAAYAGAPAKGKKKMANDIKSETAVLAGGCFWGMQEILRALPGVISTVVGYTGGSAANPKYDDVKTGSTGHAESIEIKFDPAKISYGALLDMFFKMHDPTTPGRQGNDTGSQ